MSVSKAIRIFAPVSAAIALGYMVAAWRLPWGHLDSPGAAVFPLLVGTLWLGVSLALLVEHWGGKDSSPSEFPRGRDLARMLGVPLITAVYIVLLEPVGYVVSTLLLMLACLRLFGLADWRLVVLFSVLVAVVTYVAFSQLLLVPLPRGDWLP